MTIPAYFTRQPREDLSVEPFPLPESVARPTRRPRIYLAGPISRGDLAHNINQATAAFKALAEAGLAPWCPHWSCFSGGATVIPATGTVHALATTGGCGLSHADWLAVDLAWVEAADAVLRLPGESVGADRECEHAESLGIPVHDSLPLLLARFGKLRVSP